MKKIIKNILLIFSLILLLELIIFIFKKEHKINYKIVASSKTFLVSENYQNNKYYFNITLDSKTFSFSYDNKFSKTKKVLKDVLYYQKDDLVCVYPILKNDNYLNIICHKNDNLYTYNYNEEELLPFYNIIKEKGYLSNNLISSENIEKYKELEVYKDNLLDDTYIYLWKYNGFYTINSNKTSSIDLFETDTYINELGIKVGKYYIIPNYDDKYDYHKFYIINMTNNKVKELKLKKKTTISNDYYINGIVKNNLYIFDKDSLVQYKINPKKNKIEEVGNSKLKGLYYEDGFSKKNIYEFKQTNLIFKETITIPKEIDKYDSIYNYKDNYYYTLDNDMILYDDVTKTKIYLFKLSDISNISLVNDDLYFIKNDTLYFYNISYGFRKLVIYDELNFNKTNRYIVYKK